MGRSYRAFKGPVGCMSVNHSVWDGFHDSISLHLAVAFEPAVLRSSNQRTSMPIVDLTSPPRVNSPIQTWGPAWGRVTEPCGFMELRPLFGRPISSCGCTVTWSYWCPRRHPEVRFRSRDGQWPETIKFRRRSVDRLRLPSQFADSNCVTSSGAPSQVTVPGTSDPPLSIPTAD